MGAIVDHGAVDNRRLGKTGLTVSALGFGCGAVGGLMVRGERADQLRAVALALDAGITYFDTAPSYGDGASEESLGRALRELGMMQNVVVGTKVRLSASDLEAPWAGVRRSLEQSLARLGRDSVDVLHLHNPIRESASGGAAIAANVVLGDVAEALRRAAADGLVGHAGLTGLGDAAALRAVLDSPDYETVQAYLNVLNPSGLVPGASGGQQDFQGLVAHASERDKGVIAIRVLAAGALSGSSERHPVAGAPPGPLALGAAYADDVRRARSLDVVARELGLENTLELALRFALSIPGVATAMVGLSSVEQLESAIRWSERGALGERDVGHLVQLATAGED
jgi:aryl-alcohol dehydrogenase-like predicted oxidoreductase